MFGNRLGWGISAVMVVLVVGGLWLFYEKATRPDPPTSLGRNAARYTLEVPISPRTIATPFMTEGGNGIEQYKQAIAEYERYARPIGEPKTQDMQRALDLIVQGSKRREPGVFADRPEKLITYDPERPALAALKHLGMAIALRQAAVYRNQNQPEKAKELYQAMFVLGMKLYEERLVWEEWRVGRELLAYSIKLTELTDDVQQKDLLRSFDAQFRTFYNDRIEQVQLAVSQIKAYEGYTGDMIALTENAPERTWRIEAALALGRCKYFGLIPADRNGARAHLQRLAQDRDPYVALAARLGRDLTVEQFRMLR